MSHAQNNPNQFLQAIDPHEDHIRHKLANLVFTGMGPNVEAMVAPEPALTNREMTKIVELSNSIPEDGPRNWIVGSRTHRGNGPLGEGPSLGQLRASQQPVDLFSVGINHAAHVRKQARKLS